jgi:hypothetical protein
VQQREHRRYEVMHVPAPVRNRDRLIGISEPVLPRYERIAFEKPLVALPGQPLAAFVCPGHPAIRRHDRPHSGASPRSASGACRKMDRVWHFARREVVNIFCSPQPRTRICENFARAGGHAPCATSLTAEKSGRIYMQRTQRHIWSRSFPKAGIRPGLEPGGASVLLRAASKLTDNA